MFDLRAQVLATDVTGRKLLIIDLRCENMTLSVMSSMRATHRLM